VGKLLPDAYDPEVISQVADLDELQTYVKKKHTKSGFIQPFNTFDRQF
jgi:hypothetical protein